MTPDSPAPHSLTPYSLTPSSLRAERALLSLRVCDPACGSGHFLVAAAHRIAKRLAAVRTGDEEPAPDAMRTALRDVIGRCIYGVDINPMSVELCKVSLWLEALEPGKPLSFLDHHIQCGNSLIGATPALMDDGIPDAAFKPIAGDDPGYCTKYRKQNREERETGQMHLDEAMPWDRLGNLAASIARLDGIDDDDIEGVRAKQARYAELVRSSGYLFNRLLADAWCAAFLWPKRPDRDLPFPITQSVFRRIEANPHWTPDWMRAEIQRLAGQYQFFHWHLAFPDVFEGVRASGSQGAREIGGGGFDVVLGNPPWERIKLQEKEFFAERAPHIAQARNAAARRRLIAALPETDPALHRAFREALRQAEGESRLVRESGRYPLCGRGDVNTYSIFAELNRELVGPAGRVGCIVPSGIATDDTTKLFFQDLTEGRALVSLYDFENRKGIFPAVDSRMKFCLLTLTGPDRPHARAEFVFFAHDPADLDEPERRFSLSADDIALLNPNTRTCPIFRSRADAELTKAVYRRAPVLIREARDGRPEENPWGVRFATLFHMSNDSHLFRTRRELEAEGCVLRGNVFTAGGDAADGDPDAAGSRYLPLYEAKMIHHFDHRWATYEGEPPAVRDVTPAEKADPAFVAQPRYWVRAADVDAALANTGWDRPWLLGWRDICRSTDERTVIAAVAGSVAYGDKWLLLFPSTNPVLASCLLGDESSFCHDYVARQKVGGTSLKYFTKRQLPVLPPSAYAQPCPWTSAPDTPLAARRSPLAPDTLAAYLLPRVLELTYTAWDLAPFARDCGYDGPPFKWDEERRFELRCELDAAFFHLYLPADANGEWRAATTAAGCPCDETAEQLAALTAHFPTPRDAVAYIMDAFPIVQRKDVKAYGEYRTKRRILEIYDGMGSRE